MITTYILVVAIWGYGTIEMPHPYESKEVCEIQARLVIADSILPWKRPVDFWCIKE